MSEKVDLFALGLQLDDYQGVVLQDMSPAPGGPSGPEYIYRAEDPEVDEEEDELLRALTDDLIEELMSSVSFNRLSVYLYETNNSRLGSQITAESIRRISC